MVGRLTVQRTRRSAWSRLLIALVSVGLPVAAANPGKLAEGVELPLLESVTLSGNAGTLPQDARGHGSVLVIGFSKASMQFTRPWMEGCRAAAGATPERPNVLCYDVRMVEGVPRAFRGMMERQMRKGLPAELLPRTFMVYTANDTWRERLGATDDKIAYVIGCDEEGRVRRVATGPYVKTELDGILAAISPKARE